MVRGSYSVFPERKGDNDDDDDENNYESEEEENNLNRFNIQNDGEVTGDNAGENVINNESESESDGNDDEENDDEDDVAKFLTKIGTSYIALPSSIQKQGTINPRKCDNNCFKWNVLGKHVTGRNKCRIASNYHQHAGKYNFKGYHLQHRCVK